MSSMFEVRGEARIMWFERVYVWLRLLERNAVYPLLFLAMVTKVKRRIIGRRYGPMDDWIETIGLRVKRNYYL